MVPVPKHRKVPKHYDQDCGYNTAYPKSGIRDPEIFFRTRDPRPGIL